MSTKRDEIEDIVADAHDEDEQMMGWENAFDEIETPFPATLLGIAIEVLCFRANDANALQCQVLRDGRERWVGVEDLDEEGLPEDCRHLLDLYRSWREGGY